MHAQVPSRRELALSRRQMHRGGFSCCTFSCDHLGALSVLQIHCKSQLLIQPHSGVEHKTYFLSSILPYIQLEQQ